VAVFKRFPNTPEYSYLRKYLARKRRFERSDVVPFLPRQCAFDLICNNVESAALEAQGPMHRFTRRRNAATQILGLPMGILFAGCTATIERRKALAAPVEKTP
jgi:hypothetical protein